MTPDLAIQTLDVYANAGVTTNLWGAPGTGKTSGIEAWAESRGRKLTVLIGSLMDPTEIGGIPMRDLHEPTYDFALPRWFHNIVTDQTGEKHCVFFDEVNTAPPATMAALLRLVQSRAIHDKRLPDDVYFVCAGNDPKHMDLADPLPSAMQSRLGHISWDGWGAKIIDKRNEGFPIPEPFVPPSEAKRHDAELRWGAIISGFINHKPAMVEDFQWNEGKVAKVGRGYPTQRSWDNLLTSLALADHLDDHVLNRHLTEGLVGEAPAIEFLSYAEELKLPSPESWIKDPSLTHSLGRDDKNVAMLDAISAAVEVNTSLERWAAAISIVTTMGKLTSAGVGGQAAKKLSEMAADKKVKLTGARPAALGVFTDFYYDVLVEIGAIPNRDN